MSSFTCLAMQCVINHWEEPGVGLDIPLPLRKLIWLAELDYASYTMKNTAIAAFGGRGRDKGLRFS